MHYAFAQVAQDTHLRSFPSITHTVVAGPTDVVHLYLCICMGHVSCPPPLTPLPLALKLTATRCHDQSQLFIWPLWKKIKLAD